jgi:predicted ATPase
LKRKIVAWGDPNFKAETSYLKTDEADEAAAEENKGPNEVDYGTPGSLRIDVLEDLKSGTICVYDIKTGNSRYSGLSPRRRADIRDAIFRAFRKGAQRVILTEVRPQK